MLYIAVMSLCLIWSTMLSIITIVFVVKSYSSINSFPLALVLGLNEMVYIVLLAASASGIRTLGALSSKRIGVRIFNNIVIIHLPVNICLGVALLVLLFQESFKAPVKTVAITLLIIIWGLESTGLVITTTWLKTESHRNVWHKDLKDIRQELPPAPQRVQLEIL
ncbi:hypothetical protein B0H14DRAFT_2583059 [Mycena olivaceomarginata]|nr:hypothetical protein B0H14DRAFT_2583059 [Mycena olivaceomarginata]